jgi:hypothetical protein
MNTTVTYRNQINERCSTVPHRSFRRNSRPTIAAKAATSSLKGQTRFGRSTGGPVGLGGRDSENLITIETLRSYTAHNNSVSYKESVENSNFYRVRRESEG